MHSGYGLDDDVSMDMFTATVPIFLKYLHNIEHLLDKAVSYAQDRGFDPERFMQARLAPDQFHLLRHATAACDGAKWAAAKLAGQEGPAHPDTETTIAELRERLKTAIAYLESFKSQDFVGAEERRCAHGWMEGEAMRGADYLNEFALPNFFFHVTSVYQILRHNGVPLGKVDFVGDLTFV